MDDQSVWSRIKELFSRRSIIASVLVAFLGLLVTIAGLRVLTVSASEKSDAIVISEVVSPAENHIIIDVSGAVVNPGVYTISEKSRVSDALARAGGLSADADTVWVGQKLNLAQKVSDGVKIYIPAKDENRLLGQSDIVIAGNAVISINDASVSELDALPGIGLTTAQKIIASRPYQSVDELLSRKIVNKSTFEKIKEQVSVY